jgi:NADPH:quinone reductase-like Zn-dependent oxidoreductase
MKAVLVKAFGPPVGARVIAAASSEAKLALAREHGADSLIDYGTSDLRERIREETAGKGVDVVYDPSKWCRWWVCSGAPSPRRSHNAMPRISASSSPGKVVLVMD